MIWKKTVCLASILSMTFLSGCTIQLEVTRKNPEIVTEAETEIITEAITETITEEMTDLFAG